MIDIATARYIAGLSRLHIAESDLGRLAGELEGIIKYVEQLKAVDIEGVAPTSHVLDMKDVFREDDILPSLTPAQAMLFAVDQSDNCYKVPRVIE